MIHASIKASELPAFGQPFADGTLFARQWYGDSEYALVALGAESEIEGEWGKYGQDVETNHGDGEANTRAMAEAGSELASKVLALNAFIPSALESSQMMYAKQLGYVTDLDEDDWYWTSTQYSSTYAFYTYFDTGSTDWDLKGLNFRVRPVRKILILH
ncbi:MULTISPECIES: DUF1566 domain-containing protein [unclassified Pseudomonas]|uniref:DUF1566 domain-containing protein n=1 Tax=unclassified Pseudomonas TaxID=196821 RepID=UPI0002A2E755|nr:MULTISPECIES: DUF1566 domain-containing protein [unclassified Pseudomonas]MBB1606510.1 hypothetical protein [Pseudomonas sp. UMC76]MBB1640717.1 hypothetical protein [Pseudomonas sp. UME83]NTX88149.1 DUF1566 domain-containing protein [Pseudomonas sp. UMA643]NTY18722.1 DUF1566 domain-containing protein [Pseudomonas sp. UMC3103]NTY23974.1 DUF1566 domain-containing protein [Pseudomonas sp. UMA603]